MSSGAESSQPWTPIRRMADDLDLLEARLPARAAARTSRNALAEYYRTIPKSALTSWRVARVAPSSERRAIFSGRGDVSGGEPPQIIIIDSESMNSSDEEDVDSAFKPGMDNPDDFFKEVRGKTSHKKRRGVSNSAVLLGELIKRIDQPDDAADLLQWVDDNAIPVPPARGIGPLVNAPLVHQQKGEEEEEE